MLDTVNLLFILYNIYCDRGHTNNVDLKEIRTRVHFLRVKSRKHPKECYR